MPKILIVYCSHTGNTEKMAKAIVEGARVAKHRGWFLNHEKQV